MPENQEEKTKTWLGKEKGEMLLSLATPIAIIIAGIIIAGAIFWKDSLPGGSIGNGAGQGKTGPTALLKKNTISEEIGLNKKEFAACLASGKYAAKIEADVQSGVKAGVRGTPQTYIVNTKTGLVYSINGAQPASGVKALLATAIAGKKEGATKADLDPVRADEHISGNPRAEIFIVEYSDFECPFCKTFHQTMKEIMREYPADGKVAWVYRHFPLDQIHSQARKEGEASECAAELAGNKGFWDYTNKLFEITPSNNKLDLGLL